MRRALVSRVSAPLVNLLAASAFALLPASACGSDETPLGSPVECSSRGITAAMVPSHAAGLRLLVDSSAGGGIGLAAGDVSRYLAELWAIEAPAAEYGNPADAAAPYVWISTSGEAKVLAGADQDRGYAIRNVEGPDTSVRLVVWGATEADAVHGAYALLEELGVRFFHPVEELVPHLDGAYVPAGLAVQREPAFATRGVQIHLLHPLEYFAAFNEPGEENLRTARAFIDWLVKTGQNHVQWSILGTVDFDAWLPHATAILEYAHSRGVTVGAVVILWGGASLQNAYHLIETTEGWQVELEDRLDRLAVLPFDVFEIGLGEFLASDPERLLTWIDHATAYMAEHHPSTRLTVTNHVGNYPELWVDYQGEEVFFYHLPGYADARLMNTVHTVFFFDLYRDWGGYGHPDFHLQREFLLAQLPNRTMRYMPESAYWCSADIDVPLFLPEFVHARWLDIASLVPELREKGLPPLEGHVTFTSGHEWGYWMTDYLVARMMWAPEAPMAELFGHVAAPFGGCSAAVGGALQAFTDLQTKYLFDRRLIAYLSGDDLHDDMGYLIGITTHPPRVSFDAVAALGVQEREALEASVVGGLEAFAAEGEPLAGAVAEACAGADEALLPWCLELSDGIRITLLRAVHASRLYRAVFASLRGQSDAAAYLAQASSVTDAAAAVIAAREAHYRFDVEKLTGAYANPTIYRFGYLRQAHTQCLWRRQEEQAAYFLENGRNPPVSSLRTCQN